MAKRTKIVCTLGPSVDSESTLKGLIAAGMDVARFNLSHGTHEEHRARMERLRKVRREVDSPCAVLLDTKGPEIRTGLLAGHEPIRLMAGRAFTLTEREIEGNDRVVTQTCHGLSEVVEPGTIVLVDDGLIELAVDSVEGSDIHCTVQNSGMLGERKSINLPGVCVPLPTMTDQDRSDLLFGIEQKNDAGEKVDYTTEDCDITNSTSVMLTSVSGNDAAIGYISLGSLNETVKALTIDGVEANVENIKAGTYKNSCRISCRRWNGKRKGFR